eukprot:TRINITY_DN6066_c0_g1_i2.p1 TRINITY_DN6066_c0_g1~~TRINITY_DN6066_c0_g1_i2.p1  ORF type:complete len:790 (-),score=186.10 TRINITY_DN6066_c0_g1_i2:143-2263(-)
MRRVQVKVPDDCDVGQFFVFGHKGRVLRVQASAPAGGWMWAAVGPSHPSPGRLYCYEEKVPDEALRTQQTPEEVARHAEPQTDARHELAKVLEQTPLHILKSVLLDVLQPEQFTKTLQLIERASQEEVAHQSKGVRIKGKDGLANKLNGLKEQFGERPESVWLFFDWDKTIKLPFLGDVDSELPVNSPQWKKDLAKDLRGGAATLNALECSPFQKFIVTAKRPQLGNPATGLVTEVGSTLKDPIFLRMHKCFSMVNVGKTTIRYTPEGHDTIEYTEDQTLEAACWDKVPKNELVAAKTASDKDGKLNEFPQNWKDEKDGGKWKFHGDIESTPCEAPKEETGQQEKHPANGGMHYFPRDCKHDGWLLKRVGNVYSSGYAKHLAIAKALQLAKEKGQALPSRIYFFDDNVSNAFDVHTLTQEKIMEVLGPSQSIYVEGIFWDPFEEEMEGNCAVAPAVGGSDFQLDGVIKYPNFRDDHRSAIEQGLDQVKRKHLEFFGLNTDDLVDRLKAYLPLWEKEAKEKGVKLGEVGGEAAKSEKQLKEEQDAREKEIREEAEMKAKELGLEETDKGMRQTEALATLMGGGPTITGVAAIPQHNLEKAQKRRLKWQEEVEKFVNGEVAYDALSEDCKANFSQEGGAEKYLEKIRTELEEIQKRLAPKPKKGGIPKGKGKKGGKEAAKRKVQEPDKAGEESSGSDDIDFDLYAKSN